MQKRQPKAVSSIESLNIKDFSKSLKKISQKNLEKVWETWSSKVWRECELGGKESLPILLDMLEVLLLQENIPPNPCLARSPSATLAAVFMNGNYQEYVLKASKLLSLCLEKADWKESSVSFSGVMDVAARMCCGDRAGLGVLFMRDFAKYASVPLLISALERSSGFPFLLCEEGKMEDVLDALTDRYCLNEVFSWGLPLGLVSDMHLPLFDSLSLSVLAKSSREGLAGRLFARAFAEGVWDRKKTTEAVVLALAIDESAYESALCEGFVPDADAWADALDDVSSSCESEKSRIPVEFDFRGTPIQGELDFC